MRATVGDLVYISYPKNDEYYKHSTHGILIDIVEVLGGSYAYIVVHQDGRVVRCDEEDSTIVSVNKCSKEELLTHSNPQVRALALL